MDSANYYQVLGVPKSATTSQIKASYKVLAKKFHPDLNGDTKQMAALNEAYRTLSNPQERLRYNRKLEQETVKRYVDESDEGYVYTPHARQQTRRPATRPAHQATYAQASRSMPRKKSHPFQKFAWAAVLAIIAGLLFGAVSNSTTPNISTVGANGVTEPFTSSGSTSGRSTSGLGTFDAPTQSPSNSGSSSDLSPTLETPTQNNSGTTNDNAGSSTNNSTDTQNQQSQSCSGSRYSRRYAKCINSQTTCNSPDSTAYQYFGC